MQTDLTSAAGRDILSKSHPQDQAATKRISNFGYFNPLSSNPTLYTTLYHTLAHKVSCRPQSSYLLVLRCCQISMGMPSPDHASRLKLQAVHIGVAKAHTFGKGLRWWFPIAFWAIRAVRAIKIPQWTGLFVALAFYSPPQTLTWRDT